MKKLSFYDVKNKKKFMSAKYKIKVKNKRRFAIAKSPSGIESWRVLGMVKKKTVKRKKK